MTKSELFASIWKESDFWRDTNTRAVVTAVLRSSKAACSLLLYVQTCSEHVRSKRDQALVEKSQMNLQ